MMAREGKRKVLKRYFFEVFRAERHYFFRWTIQMKFLAIILNAGTHL